MDNIFVDNILVRVDIILAIMIPFFLSFLSLCALGIKQKSLLQNSVKAMGDIPSCAIFVPCKGIPNNFEENLNSFLSLKYPIYSLYFAVESEDDLATAIIRYKIQQYPNANLIIAGKTQGCGQKNWNLSTAVMQSEYADILIFADSDIAPDTQWVEQVVAPLQYAEVTAVTGFRWLYSPCNALGSWAHSFQNYLLYILFSVSAHFFNIGLWGGTMAIRRKDYDVLGVAQRWRETSVDDLSLSELLKKKKRKIHFSYRAITETSDTLPSLKKSVVWFERQVMYLKAHEKVAWFLATVLVLILTIFMMRMIFLIGLSFVTGSLDLLYVPGIFLGGLFLFSAFFALHGKKGNLLGFVLFSPLSLLTVCIAVLRTVFTNIITWSGYRYTVRFRDGVVKHVEKIST